MWDQRQDNRDEHRRGDGSVYHAEIQEPEQGGRYCPDKVDFPAPDAVGHVPEQRNADKRDARRDQYRAQDQVARHMQRAYGIGKDEGSKDIERCLLSHPQQGRKNDLLRLFLEHFDNRRFLDLVFIQKLLEHRSLKNAETNPQANPNQYDRERERNSPPPVGERISRQSAERQDRQVREEQTSGNAELRPRCNQPTLAMMTRPFHRQQD